MVWADRKTAGVFVLAGLLLGGCPHVDRQVVPPTPVLLTLTSDQLFPVLVETGRAGADYQTGYINQIGEVTIAPQFRWGGEFSEGLAVVEVLPTQPQAGENPDTLEARYGYVDRTGKLVISARFSYARSFADGMAAVREEGRWGYIDRLGKQVISLPSDIPEEYISNFSGGLAVFYEQGTFKAGYIDKTGKVVIPAQYNAAGSFSEGLAVVEQNGRPGIIDRTGQEVVPFQFFSQGTFPTRFSEGLLNVEMDDRGLMQNSSVNRGRNWGFVDRSGQVVIPPRFKAAYPFADGLAPVLIEGRQRGNLIEGGKWGYINRTGEWVIPAEFDMASSFSEGRAVVVKGRRCGYIDTAGDWVVRPQYDVFSCQSFKNGLAAIKPADSRLPDFYINRAGQVVWPRALRQP